MASRTCPICGEPAPDPQKPAFPFCSRRCRLVDLGNWLGEGYRLPDDPSFPDAAPEAEGNGPW